jgi:hypothetical protein
MAPLSQMLYTNVYRQQYQNIDLSIAYNIDEYFTAILGQSPKLTWSVGPNTCWVGFWSQRGSRLESRIWKLGQVGHHTEFVDIWIAHVSWLDQLNRRIDIDVNLMINIYFHYVVKWVYIVSWSTACVEMSSKILTSFSVFVFVWFNVRQNNNGYIDVSFWERKYQLRGWENTTSLQRDIIRQVLSEYNGLHS